MSPPSRGPVFIVGAPRSGTTMLQYLLDDLENLAFPTGESHFIVPMQRSQASFGNLDTPAGMTRLLRTLHDFNAEFLDTDLHGIRFDVAALSAIFLAENRASPREVITGLFEHNARGLGKSRWGDKTPYYALHLERILDWWPDAQFIHLIRDGRDVALSLFGRAHDFSAYNTYYAAQYWQKYVDACRQQGQRLSSAQYLEVRYEDLLADQAATMRTISDFLGERWLPAQHAGRESGAARNLKRVRPDNQGKWRRALTRWQIRVFESEAGGTLAQCGYPLLTRPRRLPLPVRALYRLHNDWSMRLYRRLGRNRRKLNFVPPASAASAPSTGS